jgi:hypothetical protein
MHYEDLQYLIRMFGGNARVADVYAAITLIVELGEKFQREAK